MLVIALVAIVLIGAVAVSVHWGGKGPGHVSRKIGAGGGTVSAAAALKFNVSSNSQYVPLLAF